MTLNEGTLEQRLGRRGTPLRASARCRTAIITSPGHVHAVRAGLVIKP